MDEVWKLFKMGFLGFGIWIAGTVIWDVAVGMSLAVLFIVMVMLYAIAKTVYQRTTGAM